MMMIFHLKIARSRFSTAFSILGAPRSWNGNPSKNPYCTTRCIHPESESSEWMTPANSRACSSR